MREKLIQIIGRYTPRYLGGVNIDAADKILAEIRCEHCKHWKEPFGGIGYKICTKQNSPAQGRATEPYFFCAYWEGK